jgi:hypothetical protein
METFTELEYREKLEPIYRVVFANNDPYDAPFQPIIQPRLLLFEFQWSLSEPWLTPVVLAAKDLGEEGFYVSALGRPEPEKQTQPYHWYVPLKEADSYGSVVISQENAIYSINGWWGIICSDEDHALVGGPEVLIGNIRKAVPDLEQRVYEFLDMWKHYHERNNVKLNWMPLMLTHIFGPEKAEDLLGNAQLGWLLQGKD